MKLWQYIILSSVLLDLNTPGCNGDRSRIADGIGTQATDEIDDEGLTDRRVKNAMHDMTPSGEKTNHVRIPAPKDENSAEAKIQSEQQLMNKVNRTGRSDKLHHLLRSTICNQARGNMEPAECALLEKRRYRIMSTVEKRKYAGTAVLWEKGIIPYAFDTKKPESKQGKQEILSAMKYMEHVSCLKFVKYTQGVHQKYGLSHTTYLNFLTAKGGCWSYVGRIDRAIQPIAACGSFSVALHEIIHAIGGEHEQSRSDRDAWIQILMMNIPSGYRNNFGKDNNMKLLGTKYDYGSVMQYSLRSFSQNKYDDMVIYDNDLRFLLGRRTGGLSHYDKMALNRIYKCKDSKCPNFATRCQNEGFVGYEGGKCKCVCPNGLMGATCEEMYKPANIPTEWPSGSYGLPKPTHGCPSGTWSTGSRLQTTIGNSFTSHPIHMDIFGDEVTHSFCMRGSAKGNPATWMPGHYCIYKKGSCPDGFLAGAIQFDDANKKNRNKVNGKTPDGSFGRDTKFYYCCRQDGLQHLPIKLPLDKPFYLFMSANAHQCQRVEGTTHFKEYIYINEGKNPKHSTEGLHPKLYGLKRNQYWLPFCYYVPEVFSCGGTLTLTDDKSVQYIKSPNYPGNYGNNKKCLWLIKSPTETQIQVAMEDFDVEDNSLGGCSDSLEIRHHIISQPAARYCGSYFTKSITSNFNSMMLIFRSNSAVVKKGFNAKISVVKSSRYGCYNIADKGRSYSGRVNYTRDYTKCVSWAAAKTCPYSKQKANNALLGDHNYCRNPSGAEQPWCYIEADSCKTGLCDVCGINRCYDKIAHCSSEKASSASFCAAEGFSKCHKTCGYCGKDMTGPAASCKQILGHSAKDRANLDTAFAVSYIPEPHKPITCAGYVSGWRLYSKAAGFFFPQIWRPIGNKKYKLVQENLLNLTKTGVNHIKIGKSERKVVKKGDVLGFYVMSSNPVPYDAKSCTENNGLYNDSDSTFNVGSTLTYRPISSGGKPCRQYSLEAIIEGNVTPK